MSHASAMSCRGGDIRPMLMQYLGMSTSPLSERIAAAARELQGETGAQHTMDKAVTLAVRLVDHCEDSGISLVHPNSRIDTPAATSDVVVRIDELQYQHDEGPCLTAIRESEVVYSPDLSSESRWPAWAREVVAETGVRSMLCFRLFNDHTLGALNLYSTGLNAFDEDDRAEGLALAAHAAVAMTAAQEADHLRTAMDTRTVIGQAAGILMERFDLTEDHAFAVLVRVSSTTNTKLRQVAADLVRTRKMP